MKKLLALLVCIVLTASLTACSGSFWYPFNVLFEDSVSVDDIEPTEQPGDTDGTTVSEDDVEGEYSDIEGGYGEKATAEPQVTETTSTGKYKVVYKFEEPEYFSFDIEHLDLTDSLRGKLSGLSTKEDTKKFIQENIKNISSLGTNGKYWQDSENTKDIGCYYETENGDISLNRNSDGSCTILDYRYNMKNLNDFDKSYSAFCDLVLKHFNINLRNIGEFNAVVKDTVTNKKEQKSVMLSIEGFDCESWLEITCGYNKYGDEGFFSYTLFSEH